MSRFRHFRYVKVEGYESAYDAYDRGWRSLGEVERNGPNDWIAELHDGTRATGRTRDAAMDAALTEQVTKTEENA